MASDDFRTRPAFKWEIASSRDLDAIRDAIPRFDYLPYGPRAGGGALKGNLEFTKVREEG